MTAASSGRLWGVASGLGAGAMWGLVFLAPKFAPEASPLLLTAGRYLAYGLIAAVLIAPRWRRLAPLIEGRTWRALVWLSLAGNLVYFAFVVVAVHLAGVAASALIVGMVPVVVALWGLRDHSGPSLSRAAPARPGSPGRSSPRARGAGSPHEIAGGAGRRCGIPPWCRHAHNGRPRRQRPPRSGIGGDIKPGCPEPQRGPDACWCAIRCGPGERGAFVAT